MKRMFHLYLKKTTLEYILFIFFRNGIKLISYILSYTILDVLKGEL